MSKQKLRDLYRAPFPLYTIKIDSKTGLVITAGGGGASKTGIKNAVQFLSLELVGNQHTATLVHSHDTESCATMNMALGGDVIAAGQDGNCCLMRFREKVSKEGQSNAPKDAGSGEPGNARKRGTKKQSDAGGDTVPQTKDKSVQISVEKVGEVHSDFSPLDPLQKCVRFSSDLTLLLTGGADGYLRAWEYPSLREKLNFKAHQDEIEDIDISPDNKHIVTAGRDFACSVWKNDQLVLGLRWHENMPHITDKMYRYQSCRFAEVEGQKDKLKLFTVQIPHKRERNPPPCYLTKWDGKNFLPLLTKPCGTEVISCFSVSDTGTFLGLGTVTGSVSIYSGFFLQKLYHVNESHGIVVTELAFLPNDPKSKPFKGNNEVAMLSVAVDSRCQLHNIPKWMEVKSQLGLAQLLLEAL
ncbi:Prolactin regulatory element-binding protein [Bagarius yarrelli]|uniref:Prolactin regulatory element-binding protein n=1 Tax=Bagarius yarrelli TaxID=175774 RepID=A0A556V0M1_BAGYA|nr:Prolactin regulatory element-binding protein [Bagarius yarrelli]